MGFQANYGKTQEHILNWQDNIEEMNRHEFKK